MFPNLDYPPRQSYFIFSFHVFFSHIRQLHSAHLAQSWPIFKIIFDNFIASFEYSGTCITTFILQFNIKSTVHMKNFTEMKS